MSSFMNLATVISLFMSYFEKSAKSFDGVATLSGSLEL